MCGLRYLKIMTSLDLRRSVRQTLGSLVCPSRAGTRQVLKLSMKLSYPIEIGGLSLNMSQHVFESGEILMTATFRARCPSAPGRRFEIKTGLWDGLGLHLGASRGKPWGARPWKLGARRLQPSKFLKQYFADVRQLARTGTTEVYTKDMMEEAPRDSL